MLMLIVAAAAFTFITVLVSIIQESDYRILLYIYPVFFLYNI